MSTGNEQEINVVEDASLHSNLDFINPEKELSEVQIIEMRLVDFIIKNSTETFEYFNDKLALANHKIDELVKQNIILNEKVNEFEATLKLSEMDEYRLLEVDAAASAIVDAEDEPFDEEIEALINTEEHLSVNDESTVEAVEEPTAEAVEEPIAEAVEEPTAEAVEEPIAEAVEEPIAEAVEEPIAEAVEEPTAEAETKTIIITNVLEKGVVTPSGRVKESGKKFIKAITRNFLSFIDLEVEKTIYDGYVNVIITTNEFTAIEYIMENKPYLEAGWCVFQDFLGGNLETFNLRYKDRENDTNAFYELTIRN